MLKKETKMNVVSDHCSPIYFEECIVEEQLRD
uniref:Uncharacterized protein n=1 Tax=Lepeophtheirus salmonis TaxID=72036 RepID=A0A0K2UYK6_LEPSM